MREQKLATLRGGAKVNQPTKISDLVGGYSRVENVISHDVTFADGFAAGTKNTIKMILGISEVKFVAEVENWTNGDTGEVDLPINS